MGVRFSSTVEINEEKLAFALATENAPAPTLEALFPAADFARELVISL